MRPMPELSLTRSIQTIFLSHMSEKKLCISFPPRYMNGILQLLDPNGITAKHDNVKSIGS